MARTFYQLGASSFSPVAAGGEPAKQSPRPSPQAKPSINSFWKTQWSTLQAIPAELDLCAPVCPVRVGLARACGDSAC